MIAEAFYKVKVSSGFPKVTTDVKIEEKFNTYSAEFNGCLPRALLGTGEPPHSGCHLAILVAVTIIVAAVIALYFYIQFGDRY